MNRALRIPAKNTNDSTQMQRKKDIIVIQREYELSDKTLNTQWLSLNNCLQLSQAPCHSSIYVSRKWHANGHTKCVESDARKQLVVICFQYFSNLIFIECVVDEWHPRNIYFYLWQSRATLTSRRLGSLESHAICSLRNNATASTLHKRWDFSITEASLIASEKDIIVPWEECVAMQPWPFELSVEEQVNSINSKYFETERDGFMRQKLYWSDKKSISPKQGMGFI